MLCGPAVSVDVFNVADPAETAWAAPRFAEPSLNWTDPPMVPAPVTVAVNVTSCPYRLLVGDAPTAVVVSALATLTLTVFDVLVAKFASPVYTAETVCVPAPSE